MRSPLLLAGVAALAAACGGARTMPGAACTLNTDCDPSEVCDRNRGLCVARSELRKDAATTTEDASQQQQQSDSGVRDTGSGAYDAGNMMVPDADQPMGMEDASQGTRDAGSPDLGAPDTGFDAGCAMPISVNGFAGYCTITDAINAAPNNAQIEVPALVYAETLDIAKPITLHGTGVSSVILGGGTIAPITVRTNGVTIQDFKIDAAGAGAIQLAGSTTLSRLEVDNGAGIVIQVSLAGTQADLDHVIINGATDNATSPGEAVLADAGTILNMTACEIYDAGYSGITAIQAPATIDSTIVQNCGHAFCDQDYTMCGFGIIIDTGSGIIRNGTVVEANASAGVLAYDGSLDMEGSSSLNNGHRYETRAPGIIVDGADPVLIINNNLSGNQDEGVWCATSSSNVDTCTGNTHQNNSSWSNCNGC